jgi:hypothetical protein
MIHIKFREIYIAGLCTICACLILFIWVLPNTIALRHALLIIGFISSIFLIKNNLACIVNGGARLLPLATLFFLYVWVAIHYFIFSLNPSLELNEIRGLWMRSIAGSFMAIGLGISLVKYPSLRKYFYIACFSTPAINVASYLWYCYLQGSFMHPNYFIRFLFTKIETAYFGGVAASIAVGNLIYLLQSRECVLRYLKIAFYFCGLALVLISAVVSNTKNGILIALGLSVLLVLILLVNAIVNSVNSKALSSVAMIFVLLLIAGIWHGHNTLASSGWGAIFQDAKIGIDIDRYLHWQKTEGSVELPINQLGVPVASNTYHRVAWATVGIRLIRQYPTGYGSINRSFVGLLDEAKIYHENQGQTHSGWVDFGLAYGIPGLFLMLMTMLFIVFFTLRDRNTLALPWAIFCIGFIPFGMIAEITWKQYFEATIFFLALGSTLVAIQNQRRG